MSYHDKKGKFCKPNRAHTKVVNGQHYRVVRSHRRIDPKTGKEVRVKRGARGIAPATKVEFIEGRFISIADLFEWSKESGVKATFRHKGGTGKKRTKMVFGVERKVG